MANYTAQIMSYANNATITTGLSRCDQIVNITQTIQDLYDLYQNNISNPFARDFYNISIINYNCTIPSGKYFEQIIVFTKSISIQTQVAFASVFYDYIDLYRYTLNGFHIDPEQVFNLSSITLNDTAQSDACSSAEIAQDPFCPYNSTTPNCITTFSNPWMFNCSENTTTSTLSSLFTTNNNELFLTTIASSLNSWQLGLICSLSVLVFLFILLLVGHFFRRHLRSKRLTFSSENLFDDMKSMQKSGIPQGQAFQRARTIIQPKINPHISIPWIHERTDTNINNKNYINMKSTTPYNNRGTFIDHAKIHDPSLPLNIPKKPTYIPNNYINPVIPKVYQTTIISRPVSGTSTTQLKAITDGLQEDTLDESDIISLDQLNSTPPKKPSTPVSRQFVNMSSVDESLQDEDAWMSILAVANAELDVLNRLENEENRSQTIM